MKTQQPKVSILVPCYNVEKYLKQCLDSIVNQTLKNIEIICINDGSTDSTLSIIKQYAKKDKRFVIIDKENEGYGKSMNRGLDKATGQYIGIVESDDWADKRMFADLVKLAEKHNCDVVKSNYYKYTTENGEHNEKNNSLPEWNCGHVINPLKSNAIFWSAPAIWSAIYNRKFLVKNKIRFLESPGASFQDTGFNFKVFGCAKRAWLTTDAYLHYRCDNENSSVKSTGKIFCVCDEYEEIERFFKERGQLSFTMHQLISHIKLGTYMWNLDRLGGDARKQFAKRFNTELNEMIKKHWLILDWFESRQICRIKISISPRNIFYKAKLFLLQIIAPIYKNRIRDGKKKHILFGTLVVKASKLPQLIVEG